MTLLNVKSLALRIGERMLCNHLDFTLDAGEHWGVLGGNGIGKTTFLHTLAGLRPFAQGQITIEDTDISAWKRKALACKLGVLFQDSLDVFPSSVLETALTGRHPHLPFYAVESRHEMGLAEQALADVALTSMLHRQVETLSGGERRRLAIATLLVQDPLLWMLDEPTNHLDLHHQIVLLELIKKRVDANKGGLLMVLHDVNLVTRFCTHAMLMIDSDNIMCGTVNEVVNVKNLESLYQHSISCIEAEGKRYFYPE